MKLENQVVSLEYAKKLKELGVKQESVFCWEDDSDAEYLITRAEANREGKEWSESCPSALTVAELGEMLPYEIVLSKTDEVYLNFSKDENEWSLWYEGLDENGNDFKWESIIADTEADARAKMLIYLLENNLLTNN